MENRLRLVQQTYAQTSQEMIVIIATRGSLCHALCNGALPHHGGLWRWTVLPALGQRLGSVDHSFALLAPPVDYQLVIVGQTHLVDARGRLAAFATKRKMTISHKLYIASFIARL
jgi:hypothetical protein